MYIPWKFPTFKGFLVSLVLCGYGSFLFGWHVHEKAIIMVIVPLGLLSLESPVFAKLYLLLSAAGHFALFPLLTTVAETPIKILITVVHFVVAHIYLKKEVGVEFLPWEKLYLAGFLPLHLLTSFFEFLPFSGRYPFIPLMLTSVYCSVGVVYTWLYLCAVANREMTAPPSPKKTK